MRASIDLSTGLMIESQSHGTYETMMANAANAGYANVEVREVTDDELRALIAARDAAKPDYAGQIATLEAKTMMPRVTREFMLGYAEASFTPEQLAANIGYQKLKAFDGQIRALRALL